MGTKIRFGGKWINMESNKSISPDGLTGSWTNTSKTYNTFYTNESSKLIYVSATFRVRMLEGDNNATVTAGSNAWAWVSDSGETGENLADYTNISRVRDNGTANADNLYLNARFFVPPSCKYIIKLYNTDLNEWGTDSRISTLSWVEFDVHLKNPDNISTSLDSNSNNFQRALKAPSNNASISWSQFAQEYGVWHEPGNFGTLGQTYSTTYTINITKSGDYTLEYAIDDNGTITFDGTQVASAVKSDASWTNDPPNFVILSNVTIGSHTLVVNVENDSSGSSDWNSNPTGIAWRLKPYTIS